MAVREAAYGWAAQQAAAGGKGLSPGQTETVRREQKVQALKKKPGTIHLTSELGRCDRCGRLQVMESSMHGWQFEVSFISLY